MGLTLEVRTSRGRVPTTMLPRASNLVYGRSHRAGVSLAGLNFDTHINRTGMVALAGWFLPTLTHSPSPTPSRGWGLSHQLAESHRSPSKEKPHRCRAGPVIPITQKRDIYGGKCPAHRLSRASSLVYTSQGAAACGIGFRHGLPPELWAAAAVTRIVTLWPDCGFEVLAKCLI